MTRRDPQRMSGVLRTALPGAVARKLLPAGLTQAWRAAVGELLAQRARPICLEPGGDLVVAVASAGWRQDLSLQVPDFVQRLEAQGFEVKGIRLVIARTPPPPPPPPYRRELSRAERAWVQEQVAGVSDPDLRAALARAREAQLAAMPAEDSPAYSQLSEDQSSES